MKLFSMVFLGPEIGAALFEYQNLLAFSLEASDLSFTLSILVSYLNIMIPINNIIIYLCCY